MLEKLVSSVAHERDRETSRIVDVLVSRKETLRAARSMSRHFDSDVFRNMVKTRRALAIGMYKEGYPKTAIKLISTRNPAGANALIYEMSKDPKHDEDSIVQELLESLEFTNTCTYNGLMRHARKQFRRVERRFGQMLERGLNPNATTFFTLFESVQTQKDLDIAETIFASYEHRFQKQQPLRLCRARTWCSSAKKNIVTHIYSTTLQYYRCDD